MRFALVVLVACSNTPRERAPIAPPPEASVSPDTSAPEDAAAVAEPPPKPPTPMPCRSVNGPNQRFPKCLEHDKVVELARPIKLEIQSRSAQGADASTIVVGGGTSVGIDKGWSAMLLDARDREIVEATVTKLERARIELVARIPVDRVENFARTVRFTPLPDTRLTIPAPPEPVVLRIKNRGVTGSRGTPLVVAGGARQGIDKAWRAEVLDEARRAIPGGVATIERVDADETELRVQLTQDQLDARARAVRFTAP